MNALFLTLGLIQLCKALSEKTVMYVLFDKTKKNWANARDDCLKGGGSLLSVESMEKLNDVVYFDKTQLWKNQISSSDIWIGLYTKTAGQSCDAVKYEWQGGGSLGSWTYWYTSTYVEPNGCATDLCIRMSKTKWKTISCNINYYYICQYDEEATCSFEKLLNTGISKESEATSGGSVNYITFVMTGSLSDCLSLCRRSTIGELSCWTVQVNDSLPYQCSLFYMHTESQNFAANPKYNIATNGVHLYAKTCSYALPFTGDLVIPFKMPSMMTYPDPWSIETSTISAGTTTTSPQQTTTTTSAATTTAIPTTQETIVTTTDKDISCFKQVYQNISTAELQESIKVLQKELKVLKNGTVLSRYSKISVYESRVSAVGIGLVSSILLCVCFVLVIVADFPVLYRHIRMFCRRNVSVILH